MKALNLFLCTIHLAWLCHTPPGGVLVLDTRGIIYAPSGPSICVSVLASVFSESMCVCGVCGGFSSFLGHRRSSWTNISLLDTHQWGEGTSLEVNRAPRVLQALRRSRMTFNQGSGAWAAAGRPQGSWLYSNPPPRSHPPAGSPPWARTLTRL